MTKQDLDDVHIFAHVFAGGVQPTEIKRAAPLPTAKLASFTGAKAMCHARECNTVDLHYKKKHQLSQEKNWKKINPYYK